jgi:TP901 family phage tail tape measure protein
MARKDTIIEYQLKLKDLATKSLKRFGKTVKAETTKAQAAFAKLRTSVGKAGTAMKLFAAGATLMGLRTGVTRIKEFSREMGQVRTLMDESTTSFADTSEKVKQLSVELGKPATEVAAGLYQTLSAGVSDASEAMLMLEGATKLAVAGQGTTAESVDLMTSVFNAYGKAVTEQGVEKTADMIMKTVELGKTNMPQLAASMGKVLPIASQLGVGYEEVAGAVAALTLSGLSTSESITQLNAVFTAFLSKGELAKETFPELGDVMGAAAIKNKGLQQAMLDLTEATGGSEDLLQKLMGTAEGSKAVMALTGTSAKNFSDAISGIGEASGTAGKNLDLMLDTAATKMDQLGEAWQQAWEGFVQNAVGANNKVSKEASKDMADSLKDTGEMAGSTLRGLAGGASTIIRTFTSSIRRVGDELGMAFSGEKGLFAGKFLDDYTTATLESMKTQRLVTIEMGKLWGSVADDFDESTDSQVASINRVLDSRIQQAAEEKALYEQTANAASIALAAEKASLQEVVTELRNKKDAIEAVMAAEEAQRAAIQQARDLAPGLIVDVRAAAHGWSNDMVQGIESAQFQLELFKMSAKEGYEKDVEAATQQMNLDGMVFDLKQEQARQELIDTQTQVEADSRAAMEKAGIEASLIQQYLDGLNLMQAEDLAVFDETQDMKTSMWRDARMAQYLMLLDMLKKEQDAEAAAGGIKYKGGGGPPGLGMMAAQMGAQVAAMSVQINRVAGLMRADLAEALGTAGTSLQFFASQSVQPTTEAIANLSAQYEAAMAEIQDVGPDGLKIISPEQAASLSKMVQDAYDLEMATLQAKQAADALDKSWADTGFTFENVRDSFMTGIKEWGDALPTVQENVKQLGLEFAEGLHGAIMDFISGAKTAKEAWEDFSKAFLLEIASMIIKQMLFNMLMAIGKAMKFFATGGTVDGGLGSLTPLADGGVVNGGLGRALPVKGYATGGPIVKEPHVAVVGEGQHNEAVVPLPDGRSIPVDLGEGGGTQVSINIQAVDAKGVDELLFQKQDLITGMMQRALRENRAFRGAFTGR